MAFVEVKPEKLDLNVFNTVRNWMVLTAGNEEKCNSMIVSWGAMGVMWGKNAATVYVRQNRYTKEFMDKEGYFTLSILPESAKKDMGYLGSHSGRDGDKYAETDLHPVAVEDSMAIEEAEYVFVVRKQLAQKLTEENFIDKDVYKRWYSNADEGNEHTMYIGEIVKAYKRK